MKPVVRINRSAFRVTLLSGLLTLSATLASLYYKFSGYTQLLLVVLLAGLMVLGTVQRQRYLSKCSFIIVAAIIIYFINNAYLEDIKDLQNLLLFPTMLIFILLAPGQDSSWMIKTVNLMKVIYFFYACYTIGMFFFPGLFRITVRLFYDNATLLRYQYGIGCMPGLTNHYSTNGMLMAMAVILFGCSMVRNKTFKSGCLFVISVIALLLTGKRGHIIFAFAGFFLAYYIYLSDNKKKRITRTVGIIIIVLVSLVVIVNFVPFLAVFVDRFLESAESGDVTLGRTEIWRIAIGFFKESPILGIGWKRFQTLFELGWSAHNIYIQLLCETGIVGFVVYVTLFLYFLISTGKKLKYVRENKGIVDPNAGYLLMISLSVQVMFLLYGFTGNPLYDKEMFVPYFISCAFYMCL